MDRDFLWPHLKELPYFRALLRSIEATFYQDLDLPSPILDMGCGDGHFASVAFDQQVDIGVDPDLHSLREAGRRSAYRLLIQADGAILPLPSGSIASAFSNSVLEHIPHLDHVLVEMGRVMKSGAPLVFTVPNPGYRTELSFPKWLTRIGLSSLAYRYAEWFMRMSRTWNMFYEEEWKDKLKRAGFEVVRTFRYFPPQALSVLEWGHYFGAPTLLPRKLTGRWILWPSQWNLMLTDRIVRRYYEEPLAEDGTYSFYMARKL